MHIQLHISIQICDIFPFHIILRPCWFVFLIFYLSLCSSFFSFFWYSSLPIPTSCWNPHSCNMAEFWRKFSKVKYILNFVLSLLLLSLPNIMVPGEKGVSICVYGTVASISIAILICYLYRPLRLILPFLAKLLA